MDMLNNIASSYMSMSSAALAQSYSLALTKMQMDDTQELALQELEQMLPPSPYTFDVRV